MASITLGPCHYDMDEIAVAVAVRTDGSGWIPVCDDHKSQAESEGYEIRPDVPPEDRADSGENPDLAGPDDHDEDVLERRLDGADDSSDAEPEEKQPEHDDSGSSDAERDDQSNEVASGRSGSEDDESAEG